MNKELLRDKIKDFDLITLQDKFISMFVEYHKLKSNEVEITEELISTMFKNLKSSNLDKNKKANLRKVILELEESKSELLYRYLENII